MVVNVVVVNVSRYTVACILQVICYGLTLPFSEHDVVKECVNIYCEWLSGCLIRKKLCVPKPVMESPIHYSITMLSHLYNLFVPREKSCKSVLNGFVTFFNSKLL